MEKNIVINLLSKVRETSPLVHNITNYVVMNNTANALLAIGASPVMAHAVEEVEDMAGIASSLVINMGTLSPAWVEAMIKAGKVAKQRGIPVIFDPVGAGATPYRIKTAMQILAECAPDIIRGNASEIMSLVNAGGATKGVDSTDTVEASHEAARTLATNQKAAVVVSGPKDFITDGEKEAFVPNGSTMMTAVTGMGCTSTAVIGAFAAIEKDYFNAAIAAMYVMGIAGEMTAETAKGNGSFQMQFLDNLYCLSQKEIENVYRDEK